MNPTSKFESMHVVQLTPFFSPNRGGVETCLDLLIESMNEHNLAGTVFTFQPLSGNEFAKYFEVNGNVEIHRLAKPFEINLNWSENNAAKHSFRIIKSLYNSCSGFLKNKEKQNIIFHAHGLQAAFVCLILKFRFGIKYVTSIHAHMSEYKLGPLSFFANWIFKQSLKNSSFILVNTLKSKKEIMKYGISSERIITHVQWNSKKFFYSNKKDITKLNNIIFVARLLRIKGTRVVWKLAEQFEDINFKVIGYGEEMKFLQSLPLPNLELLGSLNPDEIAIEYFKSDLCLVPSLYEDAYPRVVTESIGCQTPVIGSHRGGIPEAMNESVGWFVSGFDEESTFREIKTIIDSLKKNVFEINLKIHNCANWANEKYSNNIFYKTLDVYEKTMKKN